MTISMNAFGVVSRSFLQPTTLGKSPAPRYMHSMDYFKNSNVIIVAGGRNDQNPNDPVLNDIWILKMNNLEW